MLAAAAGAGAGIAPGQRALLLLRVLSYDRNLPTRAGGEVRVAVVYRPGAGASERERDALVAAGGELAGRVVVGGRPVHFEPVPFEDGPAFRARLARLRPAALYVCGGLEAEVPDLARAAAEQAALSLCGDRAGLRRGLAVGLVDRGERAGIAVNPRAAAAQGADLDSALLSVAERIERE